MKKIPKAEAIRENELTILRRKVADLEAQCARQMRIEERLRESETETKSP